MTTPVLELRQLKMPVTFQFEEPLTDEEFIAFTKRNAPYRFERTRDGKITVMTVGGNGSRHEAQVGAALYAWNQIDQTGEVFSSNVGFNLPDGSCLSPDSSWVSRQVWDNLTDQQRASLPPVCPEFLIEVRSETDSRRTLEEKMVRWMENGAKLAWLIDPARAEVLIYRAGEPTETLERPDVVMGHAPVEGFLLKTAGLWKSAATA